MADNFDLMLATLRRIFPTSDLSSVAEPELVLIRRKHPAVPEHYLAFLREVGYGSLDGWFMVYSGLVEPDEIFAPDTAAVLQGLVFFGDTFGGTIVGFDTRNGWRIVGVDHHTLGITPEEAVTVGEFLVRRLLD